MEFELERKPGGQPPMVSFHWPPIFHYNCIPKVKKRQKVLLGGTLGLSQHLAVSSKGPPKGFHTFGCWGFIFWPIAFNPASAFHWKWNIFYNKVSIYEKKKRKLIHASNMYMYISMKCVLCERKVELIVHSKLATKLNVRREPTYVIVCVAHAMQH